MSYKVSSHDSNTTLTLTIEGTSYVGAIVNSTAHDVLRNVTFQDYRIFNKPRTGDKARWGMLLYNLMDCKFLGGRCENIWAEHDLYLHNILGDLTIVDHVGVQAGAQDIQVTNRRGESFDPNGTEWITHTGLHLIQGGVTDHCGLPRGSGRASFAISMFGKQMGLSQADWGPRSEWDCPVRIQDRRIVHDQIGQPAGWKMNGAILVEWRPRFELLGGYVNYDGVADQSLVLSHNNRETILDGADLNGSHYVDIDGVASGHVKLIDISNCQGNAILRVDGKKIGPISQGYRWTA